MKAVIHAGNFHAGPHRVELPSSKSISNRMLIIQHLCPQPLFLHHLSSAKDTSTLVELLKKIKEKNTGNLDTGPAGTTFRFLTALLSITEGTHFLTGSERMKERPVETLVNALRSLGADIMYTERNGFPPLKITGKKITGGELVMNTSVSSQFVSAMMLIATEMQNGLTIHFSEKPVSWPYIRMTAELMQLQGISIRLNENFVQISPGNYKKGDFTIEADWSSASYWYEVAALSEECEIHLGGLSKNSLQADVTAAAIFEKFGVKTFYHPTGIILSKEKNPGLPNRFEYNFSDCPDIAQTVACTCAGLGIEAHLSGLSTLRIKETDRISALITELKKLNISCETKKNDELIILSQKNHASPDGSWLIPHGSISTYHDHRMALAFAPLSLKCAEISIENPGVVEKSYPLWWNDLSKAGFHINYVN
ncbi:MAG: 3-phosphoshikimate 1-carboxyvinyltransferase [Bacteroidota bacterium]